MYYDPRPSVGQDTAFLTGKQAVLAPHAQLLPLPPLPPAWRCIEERAVFGGATLGEVVAEQLQHRMQSRRQP